MSSVTFQSTSVGVTFGNQNKYVTSWNGYVANPFNGQQILDFLATLPGYDINNPTLYLNTSFEWVSMYPQPSNNGFPFSIPYNFLT